MWFLEFIQRFNLNPICAKVFVWMGLTNENIVKTLIETKDYVDEYALDGIYKCFLTRLQDTLGKDWFSEGILFLKLLF